MSSTGTIPGTTSAGGSTQAGRRYSTSGSGSSGGSDATPPDANPNLYCE
jgi:hypothetical protein